MLALSDHFFCLLLVVQCVKQHIVTLCRLPVRCLCTLMIVYLRLKNFKVRIYELLGFTLNPNEQHQLIISLTHPKLKTTVKKSVKYLGQRDILVASHLDPCTPCWPSKLKVQNQTRCRNHVAYGVSLPTLGDATKCHLLQMQAWLPELQGTWLQQQSRQQCPCHHWQCPCHHQQAWGLQPRPHVSYGSVLAASCASA